MQPYLIQRKRNLENAKAWIRKNAISRKFIITSLLKRFPASEVHMHQYLIQQDLRAAETISLVDIAPPVGEKQRINGGRFGNSTEKH